MSRGLGKLQREILALIEEKARPMGRATSFLPPGFKEHRADNNG
jgi:hypothetical protein